MEFLLRDAEKLAFLFVSLVQDHLGEDLLPEAQAGDVTCAQVAALRYLGRHAPNYVGHLTTGLSISYPAATKTVDRLVAKGLVDRHQEIDDRRKEGLTLTESGLELLARVNRLRQDRLAAVLGKMDEDDRLAFLRGLRGFLTAAFQADNALISRSCERCGVECFESCVINQAHVALYGRPIAPV